MQSMCKDGIFLFLGDIYTSRSINLMKSVKCFKIFSAYKPD